MSPCRRLRALALVLALLVPVSSRAASPDSATVHPPGWRPLRWGAADGRHCGGYVLTEAATDLVAIKVDDGADQFLFTNSVGIMGNYRDDEAIGVSLDARLALGQFTVAPTLRWERWFAGRQRAGVAVSWVPGSGRGLTGPLAVVRYAPIPSVWFEGGVARYQANWDQWIDPAYGAAFPRRLEWHGYVGMGAGGGPGVTLWGVEVIGLGIVAICLAGLSS